MSFNPTSPVTGAAQTGLTTPTYTLTTDVAPAPNAKQFAITALGGTQSGVDVHSVSKPFTLTMFKPAQAAVLPKANPITGVIKSIPMNNYKIVSRKGVVPAPNQSSEVAIITTTISIPAGADTQEPANLRALLSLHIGALSQQSAGIGDTTISNLL